MNENEKEINMPGAAAAEPYPESGASALFETRELMLEKQSRNATLALWISLGAILCLLLSCLLGSVISNGDGFGGQAALMIVMLIASVLLFFLVGKKDERWYVACILLNQAGIGLAAQVILKVLDLDIQVTNLLLSGIPVAALLFCAVIFYNSTASEKRTWFLTAAIVLLAAAMVVSIVFFVREETEFFFCLAVNALMSCAGLGAIIWANRDWENRSVLKGLSVSSFSVYLIMLVLALIAIYLYLKSDDDSDSDIHLGGKSDSSGSRSRSSSGRNRADSSVSHTTSGGSSVRRSSDTSDFDLYDMWYYSPTINSSVPVRMQDMNPQEQEQYYRKIRRRKIMIRLVAILLAAGFIVGAVLLVNF